MSQKCFAYDCVPEEEPRPEVVKMADLCPYRPRPYEDKHRYIARQLQIQDGLDATFLQPEYVASFMDQGVPDDLRVRRLLWNYALGNMSPFKANRNAHWSQKRRTYRKFIDQLLVQPLSEKDPTILERNKERMKKHSVQIVKDLLRTATNYDFFRQPYEGKELLEHTYNGLIPQNLVSYQLSQLFRILFIYASLNAEGYVQGQNELAGLLLMTYRKELGPSPTEEQIFTAEADTFTSFLHMMEQMRALFDSSADAEGNGILACCKRIDFFLQYIYPVDAKRIKKCGISAAFYAVSWVTGLFVQQVRGPDLLAIWDALLANLFIRPQQIVGNHGYSMDMQNDIVRLKEAIGPNDCLVGAQRDLFQAYVPGVKMHLLERHHNVADKKRAQEIDPQLFKELSADIGAELSNAKKLSWLDYLVAICIAVIHKTIDGTPQDDQIIVELQKPMVLQFEPRPDGTIYDARALLDETAGVYQNMIRLILDKKQKIVHIQ